MAIVFNSTQNTTSATGTSVSQSFTNTSGDYLVVQVGSNSAVSESNITGVTYAGVSMTKIQYYKNTAKNTATWLYVLPAPATGANNITVSATSSMLIQIHGISFTGVNQSTTVDSIATKTQTSGTSSTHTYTTTTVADNCALVLAVWLERSPTAGTNTTLAGSYVASTFMFRSTANITPAGSSSLSWTQSDTTYSSGIIISLAPATSAPTFTPRIMVY